MSSSTHDLPVASLRTEGATSSATVGSVPKATEEAPPPAPPAEKRADEAPAPAPVRDARFWLIFVALCLSVLLAALDLASVATAAPTIVRDLHGEDFSWVGSAYTLSSSACLPMSGKLAQIFGRRPAMLSALIIFAIGSAISGSAPSMTVLIVGRAIQGVGGGGIQSMAAIVVSDLVPLRERGLFTGITGCVYTLGSVAGPFIAGSLAQLSTWRWLFYMNLPLCGVAWAVVFFFLRLRTPRDSLWQKLSNLDWIGNALITASTASTILALTWGGIKFSWSSWHILVPLIVGLAGMAGSVVYEALWAKQPTIPVVLLQNRTTVSGYIATFLHGIVIISATFYLPTWFQSVRTASPVISGLDFLPMCIVISPAAIAQGLLVHKLGYYRSVMFVGWSLLLLGMGLFTTLGVGTGIGAIAVFQIILGVGAGVLYAASFPVLAPLPLEQNAAAVSLLVFLRAFSQAWGVAISGTILQNGLRTSLPPQLLQTVPGGAELAYTIIPQIAGMPEPLRDEVRRAFARSLRTVWVVMVCVCGAGLLSAGLMRHVPLRKVTDKKWGVEEKKKVEQDGGEKGTEGN